MKKAMLVTVGTGKFGSDIAGAICISIKHQNPDYVLFLKTDLSDVKTMPFIRENSVMEGRRYDELELKDSDDVEKIATKCEEVIVGLSREGYPLQNMVVDFTSGTKAMSAGLTIAAMNRRVGTLVYVAGDRGEGGRVIQGTERPIAIHPNRIIANSLFEEAVDLFNKYQYEASIKSLENASNLLADSSFLKKVEVLTTLCQAYLKWDKFYLKDGFEILRQIKKQELLREWRIEETIKENMQILHKENDNLFCVERMVDLLENARRRGDGDNKYDDAMARLYRLCEYIAQFHIFKKGLYKIKNSDVDTSDISISRLNTALQEKFARYKDRKEDKVTLPLHASYELLYELGEPIGRGFLDNHDLSKKLLGLRNNSILAHGFNPISEKTYKDMLQAMETLLKSFIGNFDQIKKRIRFPSIEGNT